MTTQIPLHAVRYLAAAERDDAVTALACLTPDAVIIDDGRTYVGEQIGRWLDRSASEYVYTRDFRGLEPIDACTFAARYRLEGNFPGGVVDLRYLLTVAADGRVERLEIAV